VKKLVKKKVKISGDEVFSSLQESQPRITRMNQSNKKGPTEEEEELPQYSKSSSLLERFSDKIAVFRIV
jgi:hypothetical protein